MDKKITIVIPCYNEILGIKVTHERVFNVLNTSFNDFEIIYINDGSIDGTKECLSEISKLSKKIKVINFSRNFGHQSAVSAGIKNSTGDYVVIMDADLQDPPEIIPEMVQLAINENANGVYAVRKSRKGESVFKKATAKIYYRIVNSLSDVKIPIDTGDFRLIDRRLVAEYSRFEESQKYIRGIISWIGFKQVPFYYDRDVRIAGSSNYSISKMIQFASRGIAYFSKKPLQLATNLGLGLVVGSFIMLFFQFVKWIVSPSDFVIGWISLFTAIVFFGGIQMLTIGILGTYIGNIFDEVKKRPEYIIESIENE